MIKVDNLEVGKRYWIDGCKNISGIYQGRDRHNAIIFKNIITLESYNGMYDLENERLRFWYDDVLFPEYKVTSKQLELAF